MDSRCAFPLFLPPLPNLSHRCLFSESRSFSYRILPSLCALPPRPDTLSPSASGPQSDAVSTKVVVVPGKFDSLHVGHRLLARTAANYGKPMLLSFSGMSSALGWKPRLPVIAEIERDRLLRLWTHSFGVPVSWKVLPFEGVRDMSPSCFLRMMVDQLSATTIICGPDWQFGKDRAGDVNLLREIGPKLGLEVVIVQPQSVEGIVSSTRIRKALTEGDVQLANTLLGRHHRVVGYVGQIEENTVTCDSFLNMLPGPSQYHAAVRIEGSPDVIHTSVTVVQTGAQAIVQIPVTDTIYYDRCEVHIDFVSRVHN